MKSSTSEQVAKAKLKIEQAKKRLQAIESRASQANRKLDTRRKIILGGLLIMALVGTILRLQSGFRAYDARTPTP